SEFTTAVERTAPGMVMGTAGYMAPEQARGDVVDERADIFAVGVILWEMLSGQRAFHRDTVAETLTAILREEGPALLHVNRTIPPGLARLVAHCLEKRPSERFQSARDLAFALDTVGNVPGGVTGIPDTFKRAFRWGPWQRVAAVAAAVILLGGAFIA